MLVPVGHSYAQVMGLLMKAHKTEMDGSLAQKLVSAQLKGA